MKRPEFFDDIVGHKWLIEYLTDHVAKGTLHHFLIIDGQEGLGKTSIADIIALSLVYGLNDSPERHKAYEDVVVTGKSNDNIKRFKCSVDGGKDVARTIKDEMNTTFVLQGPKVIICDECHGFTEQAQDVFLSETEFIANNVYLIMLTTEVSKLRASLRSRAVPIHLNPLKQAEMMQVLRKEVVARKLNVQSQEATLNLIADWACCKPRAGLNILNAFSSGQAVSTNAIRALIGTMSVEDVLPLLSSLSGSMTFGLSYITEMVIDDTLVNLVIECINVKMGQGSYKLKMEESVKVRKELENVTVEQLTRFLAGITKMGKLSRNLIISAYINAHANKEALFSKDQTEAIAMENVQRANAEIESVASAVSKAPTLDELLENSSIVK